MHPQLSYSQINAMKQYLDYLNEKTQYKDYSRSKSYKEWPTLGDFRYSVLRCGFIYKDN